MSCCSTSIGYLLILDTKQLDREIKCSWIVIKDSSCTLKETAIITSLQHLVMAAKSPCKPLE